MILLIHRSNQVSAPEYILLISDLAGEQRFASIVAKRLESLVSIIKYRVTIQVDSNLPLTSKPKYRVTHQVGQNLPLILKLKLRFSIWSLY